MLNPHFRIISVAGGHSGVGKTSLCCLLLSELKGYGAIKFTKEAFGMPLIDNNGVILQQGKDTAIMASSGAKKVILLSGHGLVLKDALKRALKAMSPLRGVIIEGNAPLEFLRPDLLIFVVGPDRKIKAPAVEILEKADVVVINSSSNNTKDSSLFAYKLRRGARIFFIDLKDKRGEVEGLLSYIKKSLSEVRSL